MQNVTALDFSGRAVLSREIRQSKVKILPPEDLAQRLEVDHKIGTRAWVTFLPFFPRPSLEVCLGQFVTYM